MKTIIVDDEFRSREVLKILLNKYEEVTIIGEAADIREAIELIHQTQPDVIFLDIKLRLGEGFEILDSFPERKFEIVFITSYEHYAIKAIKYNAFDYLLKPIDLDDLNKTITKLGKKIENKEVQLRNEKQFLMAHTGSTVKIIEPADIYYVIADGAYSNIYTEEGSYSTAKTLKDIEPIILGSHPFIRISRGALINVAFIKEYTKGLYFVITMKDGKIFEVSRRKKAEVLGVIGSKMG
jgi:two-component system LytT family response regulator